LPAPADFVVDRLAWFTEGTKLVASGFSTLTNIPSVWSISAGSTPPRLLRTMARQGSPSPDGTRISFTERDRSAIWVMGASGEDPRQVLSGSSGDTFPLVFWSANGRRLAFQRQRYSARRDRPNRSLARYYEQSYESLTLDTGRVVARVPDLWIDSAAALPDGSLLFLKWDSPGSDFPFQLWRVKTDVTTGAFLDVPHKITSSVDQNESKIYDMSATRDGQRVMVLRQSDQKAVFVGEFGTSPPRIINIHRLTLDERTSYPHAWTRDSRAVIFESNRNGNFDLFKQYIDQRTPQAIVATPLTEMLPQLAPDSRFLLYEARQNQIAPGSDKLMRVPVEGGTPEEVPIGGPLDEFRCALDRGKRCVLRTAVRGEYYAYYDLDPLRGKGRELARTKWIPGILGDWDVSPDGKYVAIPNHDSRDARIRVVALEAGPNDSRERELVLPELTDIRGLVWAADGQGWFVSVDTTVGNRLLYVYQDGQFRSLGDIQGWAVPSPDGRRVAFLDALWRRMPG
jgi:Tol biopolymer transport system component